MHYIAFDSHKRYTWALVESREGRKLKETKLPHEPGVIRSFLRNFDPGSPVAIETVGNWYWIVDEIEAAGMEPRLVHALKAKLMLGAVNKTDKLDVRGLNLLQRAGTLPTVWIPPHGVRDARELPRTRMFLARERTRLKNRIHATLNKYAIDISEVKDIFGVRGRELIAESIDKLPYNTRFVTGCLLEHLEEVEGRLEEIEDRMREVFMWREEIGYLMSLPGVGFILAVVIDVEVGDVERFPGAGHLASYAGVTPRVHSSGGKVKYKGLRQDVNRYLKWAFVEAANVVCRNRNRRGWGRKHVVRLYRRVSERRGHPKAIGAVARHLAESAYWVMKKRESYREPEISGGESAADT